MLERRSDSRMDEDGSLPLLDSGLRPAGGVDAALILRGAGDGSMPPPRSSTGYAAGRNLGEAAFFALLECIERHAVSLWFNRLRRPSPLTPDSETARNIAFLRRGAGSRCRLLRLGHEFSGAAAAAAFSVNAEGAAAVGYGCAPSAQLAALKAVRELCQGEFALHLEAQSAHAETLPFTRRSKLFAQNADLFETIQEEPAEEPGASGLADLCAAIRQPVRFVNLTLSENAIPVVCALAGGLRDICGETGPQEVGPL